MTREREGEGERGGRGIVGEREAEERKVGREGRGGNQG